MQHELTLDRYLFSADKTKLNLEYIHAYLSTQSYLAKGISHDLVKRSIENSLCFGVYDNGKQIGFARLVTDYATFGYLADVFIDEAYRGKGLSKNLMTFIFSIDDLKNLRRIILATADAHGLYEKVGFTLLKFPERFMEIHRPDIYRTTES